MIGKLNDPGREKIFEQTVALYAQVVANEKIKKEAIPLINGKFAELGDMVDVNFDELYTPLLANSYLDIAEKLIEEAEKKQGLSGLRGSNYNTLILDNDPEEDYGGISYN